MKQSQTKQNQSKQSQSKQSQSKRSESKVKAKQSKGKVKAPRRYAAKCGPPSEHLIPLWVKGKQATTEHPWQNCTTPDRTLHEWPQPLWNSISTHQQPLSNITRRTMLSARRNIDDPFSDQQLSYMHDLHSVLKRVKCKRDTTVYVNSLNWVWCTSHMSSQTNMLCFSM